METEYNETAFDVNELIHDFLDDFFSDEQEVLRFNINFLEKNGFEYKTDIDYMQINRFISSSYHTIKANDSQILDNLLTKFYKDLLFLTSFYTNFTAKSKESLSIYKHGFLKYYGGLTGISKIILKKEKADLQPTLKDLEELEEFLKERFEVEFDKEFESFKDNLKIIINTKIHYFEKLMWHEARKSQSIQEFFKKSKRSEKNLQEPLSTKIFIEQYLKTVDFENTKNQQWHEYLQKVLRYMD